MIQARFQWKKGLISVFSIQGHAGYAESGEDICCASVSSAVQLAINAVTENAGVKALVKVLDNRIEVRFPGEFSDFAEKMFRALAVHLEQIGEEFPGSVSVIISEV